MDSPPSYSLSITSCGPPSDIGSSGLGGSISSDSVRANFAVAEMQESDMEGKSSSQDSLACCSDGGMCGENFNTLKKGPMWSEVLSAAAAVVSAAVGDVAIKPPPEFQDSPSPSKSSDYNGTYNLKSEVDNIRNSTRSCVSNVYEFAENLVESVIEEALIIAYKMYLNQVRINDSIVDFTNDPSDTIETSFTSSLSNKKRIKNSARIWMSDFLTTSSMSNVASPIPIPTTTSNESNLPNSTQTNTSGSETTTTTPTTTITTNVATNTYQIPISITPFSTLKRPTSRSSLASLTRLSSSHNSLNTIGSGTGTGNNKADDSSFITLAMSHDVLNTNQITDMYNVPFDSDIYTVPIDVIRPFHREFIRMTPQRPKRHKHRRRKRNTSSSSCQQNYLDVHVQQPLKYHCGGARSVSGISVGGYKQRPVAVIKSQKMLNEVCCTGTCTHNVTGGNGKRHSVPSTSLTGSIKPIQHHISAKTNNNTQIKSSGEPIHMTLHEVRQYLQTLYSTSPRPQQNIISDSNGDLKYKRDKINSNHHQLAQSSMIHLPTATPKVIVLNNNNNKYNSGQTESQTAASAPISNNSSNGLIQHNNNINNNHNITNNGTLNAKKFKKSSLTTLKSKKIKDDQQCKDANIPTSPVDVNKEKIRKGQRNFSLNFKQTLCNIFRFNSRRGNLVVKNSPDHFSTISKKNDIVNCQQQNDIVLQQHDDVEIENLEYYQHHSSNCITSSSDFDCATPNSINNATTIITSGNAPQNTCVINNNGISSQKLPSILKRALPPLPKSDATGINLEKSLDPGILEISLNAALGNIDIASNGPQQLSTLRTNQSLDNAGLGSDGDEGAATNEDTSMDFATSIEKVKDYGWYWGPISGEAAEKILSNEPDGSFIVRDSSDDHYIFSLSFRLNSCVRHVRIEHDQGNFSFGSCTKFKSHTIVDFIENAVEHSRSGRYLFFLHRRPVLGPMRVQLLHPVSRFKQVQSLQHACRFVILKMVRKDLIPTLPLPRRLIDYLSAPQYYSEQLEADEMFQEQERVESPVSSSTGELEKICFTPQSGLS